MSEHDSCLSKIETLKHDLTVLLEKLVISKDRIKELQENQAELKFILKETESAYHSAEKELTEAKSGIQTIEKAITDKGVNRGWHEEIMARHREEWPTLWRAVDSLRKIKGGLK